jgi:hypothetical protein
MILNFPPENLCQVCRRRRSLLDWACGMICLRGTTALCNFRIDLRRGYRPNRVSCIKCSLYKIECFPRLGYRGRADSAGKTEFAWGKPVQKTKEESFNESVDLRLEQSFENAMPGIWYF